MATAIIPYSFSDKKSRAVAARLFWDPQMESAKPALPSLRYDRPVASENDSKAKI